MKKLPEVLIGFGAVLLFITVMAGEVVGIIAGFHKGVGNGVASVMLPPYAWGLAISKIWEPPQWKQDWTENTRALAILLVASQDQTVENQLMIGNKIDELHKWVMKMPAETRSSLKTDTERFCAQYNDYLLELINYVVENKSVPAYTKPVSYPAEPSFEQVFGDLMTEMQAVKKSLEDLLKSSEKMEDFKTGQSMYLASTVAGQQNKIKHLFLDRP